MSQATRINYAQAMPASENISATQIAQTGNKYLTILKGEIAQKVILFGTIIGLLVLASNLDNIFTGIPGF